MGSEYFLAYMKSKCTVEKLRIGLSTIVKGNMTRQSRITRQQTQILIDD